MKKGFTLVELLVVVAIIGVLVTILVPVIQDILVTAKENACKAKLKVIGQAYSGYSHDHDGRFARVHDSGDPTAALGVGTNDLNAVSRNAMNNVWRLIDEDLVPVAAFECPADESYTQRVEATKYGWTSGTQFSYGLHYPYENDGAAPPQANPADPGGETFGQNSVIMADKSSARVTGASGWENHSRGCSLLRLVGNVEFHRASTSMIDGDDLYGDTVADDGNVLPTSVDDIVILPGVVD